MFVPCGCRRSFRERLRARRLPALRNCCRLSRRALPAGTAHPHRATPFPKPREVRLGQGWGNRWWGAEDSGGTDGHRSCRVRDTEAGGLRARSSPGWWCYLHVQATSSAGGEPRCGRVLTGNWESRKRKCSARSPPGGTPRSGSVSSRRSSLYQCWIVCHLGFFSGPKPRSPVYLLVLFSHSLVCIPTKRISPLRLFSLGKDGQGRSPPLPSAVLF